MRIVHHASRQPVTLPVAELREAEIRLAVQSERKQTLLDASPILIVRKDKKTVSCT